MEPTPLESARALAAQAARNASGPSPDVSMESIGQWTGADGCVRDLTRPGHRQYLYFHAGAGTATLDGVPYALRPGMMVVVHTGASCRLALQPGAKGHWLSVSEPILRSKVLPALFVGPPGHWMSYQAPPPQPWWVGSAHRRTRIRLDRELRTAAARVGSAFDAAVVAYVLVILFTYAPGGQDGAAAPAPSDSSEGASRIVLRFRELIEQNFRTQMPIKAYCERLGVTQARLARACKAIARMTPLALTHERLVLESRRELAYSGATVAEIAYGLGFDDPAYFSRFFKQHTGLGPQHFRARNLRAAPPE